MKTLEQSLWNKIRDGDLKAFEILFYSYIKGLKLYAYDILRNKEEAEEITLDVFFTIWNKRNEILIQSSLKSYLYRSIHNRCINCIKQRSIAEKNHLNSLSDSLSGIDVSMLPVNDASAIDKLIASELESKMEIEIGNLPPQCREIFYLSRVEQLKIREIAQKMSISESTVKTQLMRAVEKLRELLKEYR